MRTSFRRVSLVALCAAAFAAAVPRAHSDEPLEKEERRSPVVKVVERVRPAVVSIRTNQLVAARYFDWYGYEESEGSLGTGVIFHPAGYVVTNAHVISRATKIFVAVDDPAAGEVEREAKQVAVDLANDLAILRLVTPPGSAAEYPWMPLGRSNDLMIGETVIAIGNPFRLGITVTTGVVSALRRSIKPRQSGETTEFKDFIQIDAAINPGNSGGPIVDITGRWIGVNTAILNRSTGAEGIGFAIPVDRVREMVGRTFKRRLARGDWSGFDLEAGRDGAPVVHDVSLQGPAARTGLRKGDVIVAFNGVSTPSLYDYRIAEVGLLERGTARLRVRREGRDLGEIEVPFATPPDPADLSRRRLGFVAREAEATDELTLGVAARMGLVVTDVARSGPAEAMGLKKNDVILALGGNQIRTLDDLSTFLDMVQADDSVDFKIRRVVGDSPFRGGRSAVMTATMMAR
jgi:serine protease Do